MKKYESTLVWGKVSLKKCHYFTCYQYSKLGLSAKGWCPPVTEVPLGTTTRLGTNLLCAPARFRRVPFREEPSFEGCPFLRGVHFWEVPTFSRGVHIRDVFTSQTYSWRLNIFEIMHDFHIITCFFDQVYFRPSVVFSRLVTSNDFSTQLVYSTRRMASF